jgi:hypothetical protein
MRKYNRFHCAGIAIPVTGLIVATIVYATAPASAEFDASSVQIIDGVAYPVDSSRQMQQLERIGGKASVQVYKFQQIFESLWHGRKLAYTLIVVTALLALLCWHIAGLVDETP